MSYDERPDLTPNERRIEAALGRLAPVEPSFDVARVAYEAGRRAGRGQLLRWRAAAAILIGALSVSLIARSSPQAIEKVVVVQAAPRETAPVQEQQPCAVAAPGKGAYITLRQAVLERGLDALPTAASAPGRNPQILRAGSSPDELRG